MPDLSLSGLSRAELDLVDRMSRRLDLVQAANKTKSAYYDGTQRVRDLGISIPPELSCLEVVVGWPGTVVDVLEERLDFLGWSDPALDDLYAANDLAAEASGGHTDALIHGVTFVATGAGMEGEPDVVVSVEGPMTMTVEWDRRAREVSAAYAVDETDDAGQAESITLYLRDQRIKAERVSGGWKVVERDMHKLGRTCVRRLVNRWRTSRSSGRSEITPAIRSLTDSCVRTLLGVEVAREFFAAPQRWVMGADQSSFQDADGQPLTAWESYLGRMLAISAPEGGGELPKVGQFAASSPDAFWSTVRGYAQLLSAEGAIPVSYLGISTDQPPSADSVRALEARLIKRAERRQAHFGRTWAGVGADAALIRDPSSAALPNTEPPTPLWRDAATPTRAAAADATTKLVQAGVLPADSSVTWDLLGLSPDQQKRLATDLARRRAEVFADEVDEA